MGFVMLQDDLIHVGRLLRSAVGLKGDTLADQLRHGGRLLPAPVRRAAQRLAEAEAMSGMPKLARQLDVASLARDYRTCIQYLGPLARGAVRHPLWLRALSWGAWAIVVVLLASIALNWAK